MRQCIAVLACCLLLGCGPARASAPVQPMDANVKSYLIALFTNDAARYSRVAAPAMSQAQMDGWNDYRQFSLIADPVITDGPTTDAATRRVMYGAVVQAQTTLGLVYQFDFALQVDPATHLVLHSTSTRRTLEPRPCCTGTAGAR